MAPLGGSGRHALASGGGRALGGGQRGVQPGRPRLQRLSARPALGPYPGDVRARRGLCRHHGDRRARNRNLPGDLDYCLDFLHRPGHGDVELCRASEPEPAQPHRGQARAPAAALLRRTAAGRYHQPRHERPGQGVRGPAARRAAADYRRPHAHGRRRHDGSLQPAAHERVCVLHAALVRCDEGYRGPHAQHRLRAAGGRGQADEQRRGGL